MKRIVLFAPCLLALGCGGPQINASVDELRAAAPSREWISMPLADVRPPAPAMCSSSGASIFGTTTHRIANTVDGVLADVIGIIGQVTSQPPAVKDPGQAMWGPIVGASSVYTLAVQRVSATEFNFFLGGQP